MRKVGSSGQDFYGEKRQERQVGHMGPDLPTVDFGPEGERPVGLAEEMIRSEFLDSRHIWGSGQRLPAACPAAN